MNTISSFSLHNFRLFEELQIHNIKNKQVIMGANGAGKTTVLWGIMLLLRGHNKLCKNPSNKVTVIDNGELAFMLGYPGLSTADVRHVVINCKKELSYEARLSATIEGRQITCNLIEPNGSIKLSFQDDPGRPVSFAFVSSETFVGVRNEIVLSDILSSTMPNMRSRFKTLTQEHQDDISNHLRDLFNIQRLQFNDESLLNVIADGTPTEIMFVGSAMRKVFVLLVMLYVLAESPAPRVLLVEEVEAQLYPTLHAKLLGLLSRLTNQFQIQLIMTANSEQAVRFFSKEEIFVLLSATSGHHIGRKDWLLSAVKVHLLDIQMSKPLVVCEGDDDVFFVTTVAKLLKLPLQAVQFHSSSSLCSSPELKTAFLHITNKVGVAPAIRYLRDPDFLHGVTPGLHAATEEFFWDLPTIESYLFVDHCERHKAASISPLQFLLDPSLAEEFASAYANSFRSQNRDGHILEMLNNWAAAVAAASHNPVTKSDILSVAKVIRGHNWVKIVMRSSTNELIAKLTESVVVHNPQLKALVESLVSFQPHKAPVVVTEQ